MTESAALAALLPAGLALLMVSVGLRLPVAGLVATLRRPRALGIGLFVQVITLPAAALLLSRVFGLPPEMAAGLILVAAAPGGVTSNYISLLVGADIALSATMTLCTTLICSFTIPLVLSLSGVGLATGAVDLARISFGMAGVALVPLLAGLAIRNACPDWSARLRHFLDPVARLVFVVIVAAVIARDWSAISAHLGAVGPACLALNLVAISAAAGASLLAHLPDPQRRAIMVEASLQNVAVTIFVANSVLLVPSLAVPGLVYVFTMNLSAIVQIGLARLQPRRRAASI